MHYCKFHWHICIFLHWYIEQLRHLHIYLPFINIKKKEPVLTNYLEKPR
jgi:hypothetical protein